MYEWKSIYDNLSDCQIEQKIAHSIPHTGIKQLPQHQADNVIESFHRIFVQRVVHMWVMRAAEPEKS